MSWSGDASKRELWRARLAKWDRSGLSAAEFCRREKISEATFYYWKPRLSGDPAAIEQGVPAFLPVSLKPAALGIEVELPNGACIRLPTTVDAALLREVLQAAALAPAGGEPC